MPDSKTCLICKSKNINKFKAQFADFIAERVFDGENMAINLLHCEKCGFAYFDYRVSDDESTKLYSGYRNKGYQKQRQKHECWYTEEINKLIGNSNLEIKNRNNNLEDILKKYINISRIQSVLDFGGDRGQFIPDVFKAVKKYVYEISGVEPCSGIQSLTSMEECYLNDYDLVICANVLEHLANPSEKVRQIKSLLKKGNYLYVELPYDSPFYKNKFSDCQFLFNRYFSWINIFKHFIKAKKYSNLQLMHEHINYFTINSIEELLNKEGFKVMCSQIKTIDAEWSKSKVISILSVLERSD